MAVAAVGRRHRTFADLLLRTEVRVVDPPAARRAPARRGMVLVVAALVCAAGSGLAYQLVYRHDRAVDQARSQIAEQGPRIVEQMLSYGASTSRTTSPTRSPWPPMPTGRS